MATKVTQKGQVTIPKAIRDHLGIRPGSAVEFKRAADGSVVIQNQGGERPKSRIRELVGHAGPGLTTDEIMKMTRGD